MQGYKIEVCGQCGRGTHMRLVWFGCLMLYFCTNCRAVFEGVTHMRNGLSYQTDDPELLSGLQHMRDEYSRECNQHG